MSNNTSVPRLKLLSSRDEVGNIRTFAFETGGLQWTAGQCQGYILPEAGDTEEENQRFFTIASAPAEKVIHISTRISQSKFKQALNRLEIGQKIQALGPEGDFTWEEDPCAPVVLVAGGIGITPYRSMLVTRDTTGKSLNATLLYFNRNEDVAFRSELASLAKRHSEFNLVVVVGQPLSAASILEHAPQAAAQTLYLSGAEAMVESIGTELRHRGVVVKQDWFPGYDEKNY